MCIGFTLRKLLSRCSLSVCCTHLDHVRRLVHDGDRCCPQTGLHLLERIEVHQHSVADALGKTGHGTAAGDDGQQIVPAAAHTAAVLLDELLERDGHLLLHRAGIVDVAADAEELGAAVVLATEASEPASTAAQDGGRHRNRLDVGHSGGAAVQADVRRERRLETRLTRLALQTLNQTSLLAADVGAVAARHIHVHVPTGARSVLAEHSLCVRLLDRDVQLVRLVPELTSHVDVRCVCSHGEPGDEASLDELVRVVSHDLSVLARAGLRLVCVDDQIVRSTVADLRHERPDEADKHTHHAVSSHPLAHSAPQRAASSFPARFGEY